MKKNHSTSRSRIALASAALAAGLVLAPVAAHAHVGLDADDPVAGADTELTFGFGHGCDGSPTTALEISMPEGLTGVHPVTDAGWAIDIERGGDAGRVSTVSYTADEAIPDALRGEVRMRVGLADDAEGTLAFPVEQICETGSASWSEVAEDGQDPHELEAPAPTLAVGSAEDSGDDHAAAPAAEAPSQALPIALGAGGLVAGLVGLGFGIAAFRRKA